MQATFGGGVSASFNGGVSGNAAFTTAVQPTASFSINTAGVGGVNATVGAPTAYSHAAGGHMSVSASLPTASVTVNPGHVGVTSAASVGGVEAAFPVGGNFSVTAGNHGYPSANFSVDVGAPKAVVSVSADHSKEKKKKGHKTEKKEGDSSSSSSEDEDDGKKSHASPKSHAAVKVTAAVPAVTLSGGGNVALMTPTVVGGSHGGSGGVTLHTGYAVPSVGVAVAPTHGGHGIVTVGGVGGVTIGGGGGIAVTAAYPTQRAVVASSGSCTLL